MCGASAVLALGLVLSGCTFAGNATTSKPTSSAPSPAASPTPQPAAEAPALEVGTIVATGRLVGNDVISGDVEVRVTGNGTFEVRLIDFRSEHNGDVELRVSPHVVEPGSECTSSIMAVSYGHLAETHPNFALLRDFTHGDPSFLDTVIITHRDPAAIDDGCVIPVLSSAVLTWTLPDMRPGLVVHDSGRTGGASGIVTIVDGEPRNYTVAPDDLIVEVTARLGITVDDLFYLNPTTLGSHELRAGDVLNLSKAHR
ncbi:hypothetical protein [Mycetocola sp.]|uniref:hypothetical protein n=1 Tax=Mycetocola sp. TaxID=1871042 RepID=UPI0039892AEF